MSALENTKHDSYYTTLCLRHFITQSDFVLEEGKPRKKRLIFICDNGMMSHQVVYTATKLGEQHGIQIEFLCLCPHHAWSLCDAHGGRVKSLLKRALGANEYPTAQELRDALETGIKKTRVFMVDPVDTEALDRDWFLLFRPFGVHRHRSFPRPCAVPGQREAHTPTRCCRLPLAQPIFLVICKVG